jgi:hypothetical protein
MVIIRDNLSPEVVCFERMVIRGWIPTLQNATSFLKDHLQDANVVPEIGDVIMYNELYYEVDNVNQNQLILGKDPNYAYSDGLNEFGSSFSIIVTTHYTSGDKLGINQQRL